MINGLNTHPMKEQGKNRENNTIKHVLQEKQKYNNYRKAIGMTIV
jgi:hypothetical protein